MALINANGEILRQEACVHGGIGAGHQRQIVYRGAAFVAVMPAAHQLMTAQPVADFAGVVAGQEAVPGAGAHALQQQLLVGARAHRDHRDPGPGAGQRGNDRQGLIHIRFIDLHQHHMGGGRFQQAQHPGEISPADEFHAKRLFDNPVQPGFDAGVVDHREDNIVIAHQLTP